jgi:hypothetical protein
MINASRLLNNTYSEIGKIICTEKYNDDGSVESISAEWEGNRVCLVSMRLIDSANENYLRREGKRIIVCQFNLFIIDQLLLWDDCLCIDTNYPFWYLVVINYRVLKSLRYFGYWIIWRLTKIGLGKLEEGAYPHWSNIYLFNWIAKLYGKLRSNK